MQPGKRLGNQTMKIASDVKIIGTATIAGEQEAQGPLANTYDTLMNDGYWGEETWEKAEAKMQKEAISKAVAKSGKSIRDIDTVFAGDLLNQCISSSYGVRDLGIPFYGLYGACSTMAESLSLGALLIDGSFAQNVVCGTSSHFASAERQFRMPMEYGGQRNFSAQWTVTGSGMAVLSNEGNGPFITHVTTGKIVDKGVTDMTNMGAAMAPAAVDTLLAHFADTGRTPADYDLILTGDLGKIGREIVVELMEDNGVKIGDRFNDCGVMVFDLEKQDMHAGGSGCGCSAIVLCGHIMNEIANGRLRKVLFLGTGALMSPTSNMQGQTIPAIAHAVVISTTKD